MQFEGWMLDPDVVYLNHGAFGAVPVAVFEAQQRWRVRAERNPHRFFGAEVLGHVDAARSRLADFVGADPAGVAFVRNATTGVNSVLQSFPFERGDRVVLTDHEYNACRNAVDAARLRHELEVVLVEIPIPVTDAAGVRDRVLDAVTSDTRLLLLDHVTSPTAIVMPVDEIVPVVEAMGVAVLVDGAHAPGMIPLALDRLGASFYTGNLHKWVCAPRGAAFVAVRADRRELMTPAVISHGWNDPSPARSRFHKLFDWTGTDDVTAWLSVPAAIDALESRPGGLQGVMARNHDKVVAARDLLIDMLGVLPVAPTDMIGSMAAVSLDHGTGQPTGVVDELTEALSSSYRIEVPVFSFPAWPRRVLRISAHEYNTFEDYVRLAEVLERLL